MRAYPFRDWRRLEGFPSVPGFNPVWDHQPLLDTFGQLQEIRTQYDFHSVDNDRYRINGQLRHSGNTYTFSGLWDYDDVMDQREGSTALERLPR